MKKITRFIVLLLSVLSFSMTLVYAEAPEWTADPPHTGFRFAVKHIYATIWGTFDRYGAISKPIPA